MQQPVARLDRQRGAHQVRFVAADHGQRSAAAARRSASARGQRARRGRETSGGRRRSARGAKGSGAQFGLDRVRIGPGQAVERQAQPDRRIARNQEQHAGAEEPFAGLPGAGAVRHRAAQRQHAADAARPAPGRTRGPAARAPADRRVGISRPARSRAGGFRATDSSGCPHAPAGSPAPDRPAAAPPARRRSGRHRPPSRVSVSSSSASKAGSRPDRLPVAAPMRVQRPARQLLARIMLADHVSAAPRPAPSAGSAGAAAARRACASSVPSRRWSIPARRNRRRRRRSARRPWSGAHRRRASARSTRAPMRQNVLPGRLVIGLGHARGFPHARDAHVEAELGLAPVRSGRRSAPRIADRAWRRAGYGPRRPSARRWHRGRPSRRRADRPPPRHADR